MDNVIEKIREFNRFYMPSMNLLGDHYLGSEYSVTETRIFFEIYENEGCNAAYISQRMNIDKSYLSRILKGHEKNGYIRREKSMGDGRAYLLYLTESGKARAEDFIRKSNEEISAIVKDLSSQERRQLTDAIDSIIKILRKGLD